MCKVVRYKIQLCRSPGTGPSIRKRMKETLYLQNNDINIHMSASFGMAAYPDDADDREGLLAPLKVSFKMALNKAVTGLIGNGAGILPRISHVKNIRSIAKQDY